MKEFVEYIGTLLLYTMLALAALAACLIIVGIVLFAVSWCLFLITHAHTFVSTGVY